MDVVLILVGTSMVALRRVGGTSAVRRLHDDGDCVGEGSTLGRWAGGTVGSGWRRRRVILLVVGARRGLFGGVRANSICAVERGSGHFHFTFAVLVAIHN